MRPVRPLAAASCLLLITLTVPGGRLAAESLAGQEAVAAERALAGSISRHDPEGGWRSGAFAMTFSESRPDGSSRETRVVIDNRTGRFEFSTTRDGAAVDGVLTPADCTLSLDGSTEISDEVREKYRLTCDRLEWIRNYYAYLWGLPMKLRDPGTILDPVARRTTFQGREVLALRVTYEEPVGGDTWYFYLDPESLELAGYRFYHDESANDGEYIVLEGLAEEAGLRLPRSRTWYVNSDDELLGTDTLVRLERVE